MYCMCTYIYMYMYIHLYMCVKNTIQIFDKKTTEENRLSASDKMFVDNK